MQRVFLHAVGSSLARPITHALGARGFQVRQVRAFDQLPTPGLDEVVVDLQDPNSLARALRDCNHAIYVYEPGALTTRAAHVTSAALATRAMCDAVRASAAVKLLVTTSTATLARPMGAALTTAYDLGLPGEDPRVDAWATVERECARYAADAMDLALLLPSCVLDPGAPPPWPRDIPDRREVNVISAADVGTLHVDALERARPGGRYVLGAVNTSLGEVRRTWPHASGNPPCLRTSLTARFGPALDVSESVRVLGLVPRPGLHAL